MKTSLDCIPCFIRQALEVSRLASQDEKIREDIMRRALSCLAATDLTKSPPYVARNLHRSLREFTGLADPYLREKEKHNQLALTLLNDMRVKIDASPDPLLMAIKTVVGANVIDLGAKNNNRAYMQDIPSLLAEAMHETLFGQDAYRQLQYTLAGAENILYLADNAGEIVFDRLFIEKISPEKVTLAVRGAPVINDATREDALAAGLRDIVKIIDNGSDAPGTILPDCSPEFQRCFAEADLIISKGQGNFETLVDEKREIYFLFKIKCPIIASHIGLSVNKHVLVRSNDGISDIGRPL